MVFIMEVSWETSFTTLYFIALYFKYYHIDLSYQLDTPF